MNKNIYLIMIIVSILQNIYSVTSLELAAQRELAKKSKLREQLSEAIQNNSLQEVKKLVSQGVDLEAQDPLGWTAEQEAEYFQFHQIKLYLKSLKVQK